MKKLLLFPFLLIFVIANCQLDLPPGVVDGINYEPGDTSAILVLYAPGKSSIYVIGDFNNWTQSSDYLMNVTPDGNRFWKGITHLTPGFEYAYQYLIDGTLRVADYNTEKILDPVNDQFIPASTYPNLKPYPTGKTTGIVSILQTAKPAYNWQVTNFVRPDKRNLVIYELLVRDFVAAQNWQTVKDSLSYLKSLGINAIEVMPFNEFEGNISWGYNPDFYFAPDKFYGTETALKQFIDECHKQGIAVIMDMVLNHSFGQSPMVQMYWDSVNNRPEANNPWYNPAPKHAFNVGYDINHESQATIDFVNRVINHWLINYKIDGFRCDLAKGFTQKQTCDNSGNNCDVNAWSAYDSSRVAIWKRYYGFMQTASAGSYCILEEFAANDEEKELSDNGMLLWGNLNKEFNQGTMGYDTPSPDGATWNFNWGIYTERGWDQPGLITYQESHDEERLMYRNEQYGNSNGLYNIKDTAIALKRNGMAAAFWSMIPGPKMMWEFGELGYDFSINRCIDGSISDNCRTDPKPVRWDYYEDADRKALYDVYSKLLKLRTTENYDSAFTTGAINDDLGSAIKWESISGDSLKVMVLGNFDVVVESATVTFPSTGIWYSYLTDSTTNIASTSVNVTLQPGEYYVFTNKGVKEIILPVEWLSFSVNKTGRQMAELRWSTASEVNNHHYEVERSANGINFSAIVTLPVNKSHNYQYTDVNPLNGINYYRIKQVDRDGKYSYSSIEKASFDNKTSWQVFPNPSYNKSLILYAQTNLSKARIFLTDISGRVIYHNAVNTVTAGQQITIPVQNLPKGIYLLKVNADEESKTKKIIIQ
jgi:glycosidase